jgi:hypothetical protein
VGHQLRRKRQTRITLEKLQKKGNCATLTMAAAISTYFGRNDDVAVPREPVGVHDAIPTILRRNYHHALFTSKKTTSPVQDNRSVLIRAVIFQ